MALLADLPIPETGPDDTPRQTAEQVMSDFTWGEPEGDESLVQQIARAIGEAIDAVVGALFGSGILTLLVWAAIIVAVGVLWCRDHPAPSGHAEALEADRPGDVARGLAPAPRVAVRGRAVRGEGRVEAGSSRPLPVVGERAHPPSAAPATSRVAPPASSASSCTTVCPWPPNPSRRPPTSSTGPGTATGRRVPTRRRSSSGTPTRCSGGSPHDRDRSRTPSRWPSREPSR